MRLRPPSNLVLTVVAILTGIFVRTGGDDAHAFLGQAMFFSSSGEDSRACLACASYAAVIRAEGPAGYWRLNESSGTTAYDSSGNGLHGTYTSATLGVSGALVGEADSGISVAGGYVTLPVSIGTTVTIEVWAKTTSLASEPMLWVTGPYGTGPDLWLPNYCGSILLNTWDSCTNPFAALPSNVTDGQYHHYVTVIDAATSTAKLYYDGSLLGSASYRNPTATSLRLSSGNVSGYAWIGSIDEVSVYHRALSAADVTRHYRAAFATYGNQILADNPAGYWRLNETTGSTAYDSSGNGLHGTYHSATLGVVGANPTESDTGISVSNGGYVSLPIAIGATVSIEVFGKTTSLSQSPMLWITGPYGAGPDLYFPPHCNAILLNVWDDCGNPFVTMPASVADGNYHHYVTVIDSATSTAKLYFDGVLAGSAGYRNPTASSLRLSSGSTSFAWNGSIDEVSVYHRALSASEVLTHYAAANPSR